MKQPIRRFGPALQNEGIDPNSDEIIVLVQSYYSTLRQNSVFLSCVDAGGQETSLNFTGPGEQPLQQAANYAATRQITGVASVSPKNSFRDIR